MSSESQNQDFSSSSNDYSQYSSSSRYSQPSYDQTGSSKYSSSPSYSQPSYEQYQPKSQSSYEQYQPKSQSQSPYTQASSPQAEEYPTQLSPQFSQALAQYKSQNPQIAQQQQQQYSQAPQYSQQQYAQPPQYSQNPQYSQQQQQYQQYSQPAQYSQYPPQLRPYDYDPNHNQPHYYQPPMPSERGAFISIFDSAFAAILGKLVIYPFIKTKKILSIRPDTPVQEKLERYRFALPQLLRQKGVGAFFENYKNYLAMFPYIALDLYFFYLLKRISYPQSHVHPMEIGWFNLATTASTASLFRYLCYMPVGEASRSLNLTNSTLPDYIAGIKNNLRNKYKVNGLAGMYPNIALNLPILMLHRGIQLGSIDSAMTAAKYHEGRTAFLRKFIMSYTLTIVARFITYPLKMSRESLLIEEPQSQQTLKNLLKRTGVLLKGWNMDTLRRATGNVFTASSSAMSFAIFYHIRDDSMRVY